MPEKKKRKSRSSTRPARGYRRPWWKRLFRRGSSEDAIEYVSRMMAGPLFILTVILVFGLTVKPEERRDYIKSLSAPITWVTDLLSDEGQAKGTEPASSAAPVLTDPTLPTPADPGMDSLSEDPSSIDPSSDDGTQNPSDSTTTTISSASTPTVDPSAEGSWYVVKQGEWLTDIARSFYGDADQWRRVWFYNLDRLPHPNRLRSGLKILIPPPGELTAEEERKVNDLLG